MTTRSEQQRRRAIRLDVFGGIIALFALGAGAWYLGSGQNARERDRRTLCIEHAVPQALLIVLIDASDPLSIVQRTAVANRLQGAIQTSAADTEIELFAIGEVTDRLLQPVADVCNPGSGEGASEWTSNPDLMKNRWQSKFLQPLDAALTHMLQSGTAKDSPIMESIQSVAVSVFERPELEHVGKRRLIIVSDMLQNTAGYSQYRGDESFSRFRASPYYLKVRPQLDGVDVTILYLRRPEFSHLQGGRHVEFWQSFFTDARARLVEVAAIEG